MAPNGVQEVAECDILIIGAGTAGCVLANRLSEDPNISIVVLEAGLNRNDDERVYTPGLSGKLLGNPEFDWQFSSEEQPGLNGRKIRHPRGKVVGGSSAINSFALIYPSASGMDAWEELGNKGWGWEGMRSYFLKFQTISPPNDDIKDQLPFINSIHNTNGPIHATLPLTVSPLQKAWLETFRELRLENTQDPVDGEALGGYISTNHISRDGRERSHAGVAYLGPVVGRENVRLITGALVQKVVFYSGEEGDVVASGVDYVKDGTQHRLRARKEVILSAGAFASPQLLELSGIGDPTLLKKTGIDVIYPNPNVGENLQDHIRGGVSFEAIDDIEVLSSRPEADLRKLYEDERKGPWAEMACYMFGYMPLDRLLSPDEAQELSDLLKRHHEASPPTHKRKRNEFVKKMSEDLSEATATVYLIRRPRGAPEDGTNWLTLCAMLSYSFSRGTVHITSPDAAQHPKIDFDYYGDDIDLEIHARHMQALTQLANVSPLAKCIKPNGKRWPDHPGVLGLETAKELLRDFAGTNYHPCGTCSMMPEEIGGVVDDKLRVYGVKNLRVVDASIMPIILRGNIISTVYAIAEKASDIISADLKTKRTT